MRKAREACWGCGKRFYTLIKVSRESLGDNNFIYEELWCLPCLQQHYEWDEWKDKESFT